jgi:translation initiation factor IF-1
MNKKGAVQIGIIMAGFVFSMLAGQIFNVSVKTSVDEEGKIVKMQPSELTKKNARIIWCKMQNKDKDYCNTL